MNLLVIVIDRLHQGYLGPYGNAWVVTSAFNRLAGNGFTFDHAVADSTDLATFYRGCWTGAHALETRTVSVAQTLPSMLKSAGFPMTVLTDESQLDLSWCGAAFDRVEVPLTENSSSAATADETHLAAFFASTTEWLSEQRQPFALWAHTRGLGAGWDAPLDEYRNRYADEEESPPPAFVDVPRLVLPENYDPDELLGYCQAYAGQVRLLDECLAGLLEWFDESSIRDDTVLVVMGARGIALGEHRRIGMWDESLHGETLRLPWFMQLPGGVGRTSRSQALVQPPDVFATVLDAMGLPIPSTETPLAGKSAMAVIRGDADTLRDRALVTNGRDERAIRTPAWFLRMLGEHAIDGDAPEARRMLYAMPDDRWETNDVASRCPDHVELLEQAVADPLAPLPEVLVNTMR